MTLAASVQEPFTALRKRLAGRYIPFTVYWEITHRCNFACRMCYNAADGRPELSLDECLDALNQLAEAGALRLVLTGGEILAHPHFFEIAEAARERRFALHLKTNAALITPHAADRIAALKPLRVDISLLGAKPETMDAIAGRPRAYKRALRGARLLKERGVRVHMFTLLMQDNLSEREAMIELTQRMGVSYEQVCTISPDDFGRAKVPEQQLRFEQIREIIRVDPGTAAICRQDPDQRTCQVGLGGCLISPSGIVYPCVELRIPAGDLRRQPFAEIWSHAPIFQELRRRHTVAHLPECAPCPLRSHCHSRCAGLAWKERGDLYAAHSSACTQALARAIAV